MNTVLMKKVLKRLKKQCNKQAKKVQKTQLANISTAISKTDVDSKNQRAARKQQKRLTKALSNTLFFQLLPDIIDTNEPQHRNSPPYSLAITSTEKLRRHKLKKSEIKRALRTLSIPLLAANDSFSASNTPSLDSITRLTIQNAHSHFAQRPFKKTPCTGCPALKGKLCKCAIKHQSQMKAC